MTGSGNPQDLEKAAALGEPSYVWRQGQERRMQMILDAAGERVSGRVLDDGCGVGSYLERLTERADSAFGLEYDFERALVARQPKTNVIRARSEELPFPTGAFDLVLSHEVLEHVSDDRRAMQEIARVLRPADPASGRAGGRLVIFTPNRYYPFETHGIILRGRYRQGNIPFVNYLPRRWRDRLAPHVRAYSRRDMQKLFAGLPLRILERRVIFGAYDNIIARRPRLGRALRWLLQSLERTPLRFFGLSHFWVAERIRDALH
ncbi:MAG TPA: class I SAM-dependent methyltransferase [Anaerolineae bacterium]|nr:class I SAM-dependent methyltransferase [Anaerolineae bacterium]